LHKRADGSSLRRRLTNYAIVLLAVFLVGLVPMWLVARGRATERDSAQHQLRLCRLENNLSSAALNARRGEYENVARRAVNSSPRCANKWIWKVSVQT